MHYYEHRMFSWTFIVLLVGLAGAMMFAFVDNRDAPLRNTLIAGGVGLSLILFALWFGTSRWGSEMKSITVDERGLTVGRLTLPPEAIGRSWVISGTDAWRGSPRGRFEGMKMTYTSFGWLGTTGDAVVVEDRSAAEPSCWLIASRDPEAVDAALAKVRRR